MTEAALLDGVVVFTPDTLTMTVYLDGMTYPSINHTGRAGGARHDQGFSVEHRSLRRSVASFAREAVVKGWRVIEHPCEATLTRYLPDARVFDIHNAGNAEFNGLTDGGAWTDDGCGERARKERYVDRGGRDRIEIILRRLPAPEGARVIAPRKKVEPKKKAPAARPVTQRARSADEVRSGDVLTFEERDALLRERGIR